ncbi:hypothetical protein N7456_004996 [Penicillium angulare]|uniref:Uncharacterized protein n=1 Tax=Penicillium angulare TaxID=116970 RepID=A0A9W9FXP9_9EURO|nr:hypothetical protein N7456_004996 [Penicillium angulare]
MAVAIEHPEIKARELATSGGTNSPLVIESPYVLDKRFEAACIVLVLNDFMPFSAASSAS